VNETHQKLDLLLSLRKYREALKLAQEAVGREPGWANGYTHMARAYVGLRNLDAALAAAREGVKRDPHDAWGYMVVAFVWRRGGAAGNALVAAVEAVRINPDLAATHATHADALNGSGKYAEALAAAETGLRLEPENPQLLLHRANALCGVGRLDDAEACLRDARQLHPSNDDIHAFLGRLALTRATGVVDPDERARLLSEAEASYRAALRIDPMQPVYRNGLTMVLRWKRWGTGIILWDDFYTSVAIFIVVLGFVMAVVRLRIQF
jgi:tetratricopeptide (TPR) repeat protein